MSYAIHMIDDKNASLVNRDQDGNVLLVEQAHKTPNGLLHLAVEIGSPTKLNTRKKG